MSHRAQILIALAVPVCAVWGYQSAASQGAPEPEVHALNGVKVELVELKRDSTEVTVRWRYHNDTGETRRLTSEATGALDPFRLAMNSYLVDERSHTRYPVEHDSHDEPICSRVGRDNQFITIYAKSTIQVWAKYSVPESVTSVTVEIEGVAPFARVVIASK